MSIVGGLSGGNLMNDWSPTNVTPSDTVDLPACGPLWVGGSGTLVVMSATGNVGTFVAYPVGWFPGRVKRVMATGTTATNIEQGF